MKLTISFYNMQDLADILLREGYGIKIMQKDDDRVTIEILEKGEDK